MIFSRSAYETPLEPGQIRLLKLNNVDWNENNVQFVGTQKIVELGDKPVYQAISYTWDFPYRRQAWENGKLVGCSEDHDQISSEELSARIVLDGLEISISDNVSRALAAFAHEAKTGWVWVDALCIKQHDTVERNHQVQLMRTIFSSAQGVLVFLGHEWSSPYGTVSEAAEIVESFTPALAAALKEKRVDASKLSSISLTDRRLEEELGIEDLYRKLSVFAQFCSSCRWFSRIWCFQEVVLARKTILHCGSSVEGHRFYWDQLGLLVRVLNTYGWDGRLAGLEYKSVVSAPDDAHYWSSSLHHMVMVRLTVRSLFGQRSVTEMDDNTSDISSWKTSAAEEATVLCDDNIEVDAEGLRYLSYSSNLNLVKSTKSTNEGFRFQSGLLYSSRHAACKDDRDKVYGMLGILELSLAEDISKWIPVDYDKSIRDVYRDAFVLALESSRSLDLIAFQDLDDKEAKDWPSWLPDLRVRHQRQPVAGRAEGLNASAGLTSLRKRKSYNGLPFQVTGLKLNAFGVCFDVVSQVLVINPNDLCSQPLRDLADVLRRHICGRRRFEVIHRTLTHDTHQGSEERHVTSSEDAFLCYLAQSFVDRVGSEQIDAARCEELIEGFIENIQEFELKTKASFEDVVQYVREELKATGGIDGCSNRDDPRQQHFAEMASAFHKAFLENMDQRELFVTERGMLGSCPTGIAIGDEIWILDGARVPFILRPGQEEFSYTFVGDTFMLDLMNGEMLNEEYATRDRLRYIDIV